MSKIEQQARSILFPDSNGTILSSRDTFTKEKQQRINNYLIAFCHLKISIINEDGETDPVASTISL